MRFTLASPTFLIVRAYGIRTFLKINILSCRSIIKIFKKKNSFKQKFYFKQSKCRAIDTNKKQFQVTLDGITYPNIIPLYRNTSIDFSCLSSTKKTKTILMWTKFFGLPIVNYGFGFQEPFKMMNCPVVDCFLTNDRKQFQEADLVLFHLRNKIDFIPSKYNNSIIIIYL